MDEKLKDYKDRHIRWQNFALTQLGYTNNIIITVGIGFFAFAFDKELLSSYSCAKDSVFSFKMLTYLLSIFGVLTSIGFGVITSLSRLYDFRITRHIAITRQRFCENCKKSPKPLPDTDFPKPKLKELTKALFKTIFIEPEFLTKDETKKILQQSELKNKFNRLRNLVNTLGVLSWKSLKLQFFFLLFSLIIYSMNLFI